MKAVALFSREAQYARVEDQLRTQAGRPAKLVQGASFPAF